MGVFDGPQSSSAGESDGLMTPNVGWSKRSWILVQEARRSLAASSSIHRTDLGDAVVVCQNFYRVD
jgi:hypothetical protein